MATFSSILADVCAGALQRLKDPRHLRVIIEVTERFRAFDQSCSVTASAVGGGLYRIEVSFGPGNVGVRRLRAIGGYLRRRFGEVGLNPEELQFLPGPSKIYCHVRP
jgi:hypothetical protein